MVYHFWATVTLTCGLVRVVSRIIVSGAYLSFPFLEHSRKIVWFNAEKVGTIVTSRLRFCNMLPVGVLAESLCSAKQLSAW